MFRKAPNCSIVPGWAEMETGKPLRRGDKTHAGEMTDSLHRDSPMKAGRFCLRDCDTACGVNVFRGNERALAAAMGGRH